MTCQAYLSYFCYTGNTLSACFWFIFSAVMETTVGLPIFKINARHLQQNTIELKIKRKTGAVPSAGIDLAIFRSLPAHYSTGLGWLVTEVFLRRNAFSNLRLQYFQLLHPLPNKFHLHSSI